METIEMTNWSLDLQRKRNFLTETFSPGEKDVIMGRGRDVSSHSGNIFLRKLVAANLFNYGQAKTKIEKSCIIEGIVNEIRCKESSSSSSIQGGFVKMCLHTNRWYEVGEERAKEKISQMFRDILHDRYASSTESRKKERHGKAIKANLQTPSTSKSAATQDSGHSASSPETNNRKRKAERAEGKKSPPSTASSLQTIDVQTNANQEITFDALFETQTHLGEFDFMDDWQLQQEKEPCIRSITDTIQIQHNHEPYSAQQCLQYVTNMNSTMPSSHYMQYNPSDKQPCTNERNEPAITESSIRALSRELDPEEKALLKCLAFS